MAFDAWNALDPLNNPEAPHSPLAMPEYQLAADQNSQQAKKARAHALFEDGEAANTFSDVYTLTTLLLAAALFFAAIAERFDSARARIALLILAGIGLIAEHISRPGAADHWRLRVRRRDRRGSHRTRSPRGSARPHRRQGAGRPVPCRLRRVALRRGGFGRCIRRRALRIARYRHQRRRPSAHRHGRGHAREGMTTLFGEPLVHTVARSSACRVRPRPRRVRRALDGLVLQYLSRAISAEQLVEAVDALGAAVAASAELRAPLSDRRPTIIAERWEK